MASEAAILLQARIVSRRFGTPLVLKNHVINRKEKITESPCLTQMSMLMACWKENSFNDKPCSNEVKVFYECVAEATAARKAGNDQRSRALSTEKVNRMLKTYPSRTQEI